jgi:hypothetical protein
VDVELLCRDVAASLWAVYHDRPGAPRLIFPVNRNGSVRVSEQESKILISQWLEREGQFYSIETPTSDTYVQSGNAPMSARADLTVYGSRQPADRLLNVELKWGTPGPEAFRKDFEKLLREGVRGLWFHTLTDAGAATWRTIEERMREAFESEAKHAHAATHCLHFAFCVLRKPMLAKFDLDFSDDWRSQFGERFEAAVSNAWQPAWADQVVSPRAAARHAVPPSYSGPPRKELVYMPSIEPRSFVHLSSKGDSYALRSFGGARPRSRWVEPDCKTTSELLVRHAIEHRVDVTHEKRDLASESDFWAERVEALNARYGIG